MKQRFQGGSSLHGMPLGVFEVEGKWPPTAKATVKVPTRPTNMASQHHLAPLRSGVMPVLNPTVPIALTCSKAKSKKVDAQK